MPTKAKSRHKPAAKKKARKKPAARKKAPAKAKAEPAPSPRPWPATEIVQRTVADLVPYAQNARTHTMEQVRRIAEAIKKWGWTNPLLVDEEGGIIAGHGRVMAAQLLELEVVPCVVARGWSEAEKRAYLIADNKIALDAGWDKSLLALELGELRQLEFDLDAVGFSPKELDKLLTTPQAPDDFPEVGEGNVSTNRQCPRCGYKWSDGTK